MAYTNEIMIITKKRESYVETKQAKECIREPLANKEDWSMKTRQ